MSQRPIVSITWLLFSLLVSFWTDGAMPNTFERVSSFKLAKSDLEGCRLMRIAE